MPYKFTRVAVIIEDRNFCARVYRFFSRASALRQRDGQYRAEEDKKRRCDYESGFNGIGPFILAARQKYAEPGRLLDFALAIGESTSLSRHANALAFEWVAGFTHSRDDALFQFASNLDAGVNLRQRQLAIQCIQGHNRIQAGVFSCLPAIALALVQFDIYAMLVDHEINL